MDYIIKRDEKINPGTPIFFSYFSIMALTLSVYQFLEVSAWGKLLKQVTLNVATYTQIMQRTWWPVASISIVTGSILLQPDLS